MLANSRSPWQIQVPVYVKFGLLGLFAAAIGYYAIFFDSHSAAPAATEPAPEIAVRVPEVDGRILALARDATREQRLVIDPEPLRHLLEKAIDVSPATALALGMPNDQIPVEEVRERSDELRGRWIWYKGVLEELNGPREGHPVENHSIYEATVRLSGDERAICTFSIPPGADIRRGGFVRIEGFFMKLRDTTYPHAINEAPMLVGREIQRDYEDWAPVKELDTALLAEVDDSDPFPGEKMWHEIEEDQGTPLWHLAAYARDTYDDLTLEDWRKRPVLNVADIHDKLVAGEVARGTPIRVLGSLVKRRAIAAPANPAGIDYWTVAYLQSQDYAGVVVPVWVPKHLGDMPLRTDLEVRGYYYRWFAYESLDGVHRRTPLFVAGDLDRYDLGTGETMETLGLIIGSLLLVMMLTIFLAQRRAKRESERHSREMDERRRRRQRAAAGAAEAPPATS